MILVEFMAGDDDYSPSKLVTYINQWPHLNVHLQPVNVAFAKDQSYETSVVVLPGLVFAAALLVSICCFISYFWQALCRLGRCCASMCKTKPEEERERSFTLLNDDDNPRGQQPEGGRESVEIEPVVVRRKVEAYSWGTVTKGIMVLLLAFSSVGFVIAFSYTGSNALKQGTTDVTQSIKELRYIIENITMVGNSLVTLSDQLNTTIESIEQQCLQVVPGDDNIDLDDEIDQIHELNEELEYLTQIAQRDVDTLTPIGDNLKTYMETTKRFGYHL